MDREPEGFRELVAGRSPALLRTAWLLIGDAHLAEDLLQTALVRTGPHWDRVRGQSGRVRADDAGAAAGGLMAAALAG